MEDLFETHKIFFTDRKEFEKAIAMNHLAIDIGYSDMILVYDNEFFRDRFFGFLNIEGFKSNFAI